MSQYGLPVLFALVIWWFSTGVILYLDGLPRRTFRWTLLGATVLLLGGLHGLAAGRDDTSVAGAYGAFTCGVLVWGWQEVSFLTGFVTGPRRTPCPPDSRGWRHFGRGIMACLYHELAIIAGAVSILAASWGGANQVGFWTYAILWGMRLSAKLNVFLGVRNLNQDWLPEHLAFLRPYLTCKPMNLLFPVSVTVASILAVLLVQRAGGAADATAAAQYTFLATMTILGLAEHWFLVLPLPFAALWNWGLRSRARSERAAAPTPTLALVGARQG